MAIIHEIQQIYSLIYPYDSNHYGLQHVLILGQQAPGRRSYEVPCMGVVSAYLLVILILYRVYLFQYTFSFSLIVYPWLVGVRVRLGRYKSIIVYNRSFQRISTMHITIYIICRPVRHTSKTFTTTTTTKAANAATRSCHRLGEIRRIISTVRLDPSRV